jgi:peptide/nickel transport system substrate-binding protein
MMGKILGSTLGQMLLRAKHWVSRFKQRWGRQRRSLLMVVLMVWVAWVSASCSQAMLEKPSAEIPRIVYSILSDPKTFNSALNQESPNVFGLTYETLATLNPLTRELEPALAESWEQSKDGLNLTVTLRENLKWSDGKPLTADDVVFTFNDIAFNEEIPTDDRDALRVGDEGKLPIVSKLDSRRVLFKVPEPFAPFLRSVNSIPIQPKHALIAAIREKGVDGKPKFLSMWGTNTAPDALVTSGAYRIQQYIPAERVIFERNPYYWRKDASGNQQPYIQQLVWQVIDSTDAELVQFRSGGLDLTSVSADNYALLKREENRGNFKIYVGDPAPSTSFIGFNLNKGKRNGKPLVDPIKSKWFNEVKFRQAVAYAIDRQAMLNNIFQGIGIMQNSPISFQSPYFASTEDNIRSYDYNLDKAKALLLSAGFQYNPQGQLLDSAGNPVRFSLITNAGNKIREAMGSQIKDDLAKAGITVDFQPINFGTLVSKLSDTLDWDVHLLGFTGVIEPNLGSNVWRLDGGLHAFNQQPAAGQDPIEGWEAAPWEKEISDLYIKAAQEVDEVKRKALYVETQRITQDYLPFIHLINPLSMSAVRNKIQGVKYSALGGSLWNIYELKLTED